MALLYRDVARIRFNAQFYHWSKTKKPTKDYAGALTDNRHAIHEPSLSRDRKWICFEQAPVRHVNRPEPVPIPCRIPVVRGQIKPSPLQRYKAKDEPQPEWPEIKNSIALADGSVIGDQGQEFIGTFTVVRWKPGSKKREAIPLSTLTEGAWSAGVPIGHNVWHSLPGKPNQFLVEAHSQRSDGPWIDTVLVDLTARTWEGFFSGCLIGISPKGEYAAMASANWIGEYKNGGARCGALEIVHIPTGTVRAITTKLVSIYGGFWM